MGIKKLEYIEGTSNQFIDTQYKPSASTKLVIDAQSIGSGTQTFFGSRNATSSTDATSFTLFSIKGASYRFDCFGKKTSVTLDPKIRHVITATPTSIDFDGTAYTISSSPIASPYNLYLTSVNTNGTADVRSGVRLYSAKIYDGSTLVRDFIPANKDGNIGLYDKVSKTFYQNGGSTAYIAGPVVNSINVKVKVDGTWHDNEGVYVNIGGTWKEVEAVYVNVNGSWKSVE